MCSRYVLLQPHLREVLAKLGIPGPAAPASALTRSRYNIPPGGGIPAVRTAPGSTRGGAAPARELTALHWGLVPSWARSADDGPINARAETLADRPSFRDAFRRRRCLIPATGFYEWHAGSQPRQAWLFRSRDEAPLCLAGLWETWHASDGTLLESCAIVTTTANSLMAPIHHRMPVIVAEEHYAPWLDPRVTDPEQLAPALQPYPAPELEATPLSPRVNSVAHDDPECLATAAPWRPAQDPQLSFELG